MVVLILCRRVPFRVVVVVASKGVTVLVKMSPSTPVVRFQSAVELLAVELRLKMIPTL